MPTLDYVFDCCCRGEGQRVCSLAHSGHIMAEWDEGVKLQVSPAAPLPRHRRAGKFLVTMVDIVLTTLNAKFSAPRRKKAVTTLNSSRPSKPEWKILTPLRQQATLLSSRTPCLRGSKELSESFVTAYPNESAGEGHDASPVRTAPPWN